MTAEEASTISTEVNLQYVYNQIGDAAQKGLYKIQLHTEDVKEHKIGERHFKRLKDLGYLVSSHKELVYGEEVDIWTVSWEPPQGNWLVVS